MMKVLLVLGLSLLTVGCVETSPPWPSPPVTSLRSFLEKATNREIRARAVELAQQDIQQGTPHVARTGGRASFAWNIPPDKVRYVENLSGVPNLPTGCSDSLLDQARTIANAYNGELMKHLPLTTAR
jgi:hypothetical protein